MATIPSVSELKELREWYSAQVKEHVEGRGVGFRDIAISVPGAQFILEKLEERCQSFEPGDDWRSQEFRILDMGIGYSTFFIADWRRQTQNTAYIGVDHNHGWLSFMHEPSMAEGRVSVSAALWHRDEFTPQVVDGWFDAIIVDHGPELHTRADDMPWLATLLKRDGIFLFDDWRPKHEGRIRRALAAIEGGNWDIDAAEHTRRYALDKAIGYATRKLLS